MRRGTPHVQSAYRMIHKRGTKLDPPLRLDMSFDESLERFIAVKPGEVDESIERSKAKRPPEDGPSGRPLRTKKRPKKVSRST
jgi:hypothetical protein